MAKQTFTRGNTGQLKQAARAYLKAYKAAFLEKANGPQGIISEHSHSTIVYCIYRYCIAYRS
jgi:hypothetical protein